jgi:hypothetical protein
VLTDSPQMKFAEVRPATPISSTLRSSHTAHPAHAAQPARYPPLVPLASHTPPASAPLVRRCLSVCEDPMATALRLPRLP